MENNQSKSNGSFLKLLGVVFLILIITGGLVYAAKLMLNKATDGKANTDGNPVLLNRAATLNDFTLTESVESSIINLKESYILVPKVDIKNLEITFRYYNESDEIIVTKTKSVGNVKKSSEYTVSIEHSFSELMKIDYLKYSVSGGTVSYFSK